MNIDPRVRARTHASTADRNLCLPALDSRVIKIAVNSSPRACKCCPRTCRPAPLRGIPTRGFRARECKQTRTKLCTPPSVIVKRRARMGTHDDGSGVRTRTRASGTYTHRHSVPVLLNVRVIFFHRVSLPRGGIHRSRYYSSCVITIYFASRYG